ncbi:MAG TPA: beta-galactosidase [Anaerolineae bacterium]|nr:beta-galactosidase [Anaerolineae bacterium]
MPTSSRVAVTRDGILIDGKPLFLLAGQLHYFRWPRAEWRDLLVQARAAGLNTIDTVIPWNLHEPAEGTFDFSDYADLPGYLDLIHELGLYAIVRPAPYICAEWENGGFPAWLTARLHRAPGSVGDRPEQAGSANGLPLRTTDPEFVEPTLRWFDRLIPLLAQRQIDRGGPIILVQVENEHWASGVYGHDAYQEQQAAALQARGVTVPFYTCMGAGRRWPEFRNGWSGIAQKLAQTRQAWPDNPMIVSELWSGWFDDWGNNRHNGKPAASLDWQLHELLAVGASGYSHWMWAGGTNLAYWGGRTVGGDTIHMAASYDYTAPVDEYGQPTEKYYVARRHHLLAGTLGTQLSRLLADAAPGGATVIAPKPVPGRAGGGSQPLRIAKNGEFVAVFLQNPSLDRQSNQVFLPGWDDLPPVHLAVEVEASSIKPLFANLPLGEDGLLLRSHSLRLLGFWPGDDVDVLALYGFEGEAGQVELVAPRGRTWTGVDAEDERVELDGRRLVVRIWISQRPREFCVAIDGRPLRLVLLTQALAERWDPAAERPSVGRTIPTSPISPTCPPLPLDNWQWLDLHERTAGDGWQPIAAPQPMELLGCLLGYGWYRAQIELAESLETTLAAPWLADRAVVFVDGERVGVLGVHPDGARSTLPLALAAGRHDIRLLADNLGRFNYGSNTGERKGLLDTLYWGGVQADISGGWTALWQEAVFAGEALANARPAHVRPDAEDVHLGHFAWSGPSVWLLRELRVPAGHRAVLTLTGDRNPGALFVNGEAVTRFSRHYGGGYIKEDIAALLRPGVNVLALNIHDYAGAAWRASLLTYDPDQALDAVWSFRPGVTPTSRPALPPDSPQRAGFWRSLFPYDPAEHGVGPFKLAMGGLHKGQIWLNGRNVVRYWQIGPQEHYKLPASWLEMENEMLVLDEG